MKSNFRIVNARTIRIYLMSAQKRGLYLKVGEVCANAIPRPLRKRHECQWDVSIQKSFRFKFRSVFAPNTLRPRHLVGINQDGGVLFDDIRGTGSGCNLVRFYSHSNHLRRWFQSESFPDDGKCVLQPIQQFWVLGDLTGDVLCPKDVIELFPQSSEGK